MEISNINTVLINTLPIFVAITLGIIAKKKNILGKDPEKVVSSLAFKFIGPFLIFDVLYGLTFNSENIGLLVSAIIIFLILLCLGSLISKILKLTRKSKYALTLTLSGFGIGSFAYPFIILSFSNEIFQNVVLFDIAIFLLMLTIGYFIAIHSSKNSNFSFQHSLKKIFSSPIVIAMLLTFILNYLGIEISDELQNVSSFFSKAFGFLASILLGLTLKIPSIKKIPTLMFTFVSRIVISLSILFFLNSVFNFNKIQSTALVLSLTAPFSTMPVIYAQEQKLDIQLSSQLTVMSILFSIISYPLIISFFI